MCGFLVVTGKQEESDFKSSLESIHYRGPDDTKVVDIGGGTIGFHRLAIMDLSANGDQPFQADSGALTLVCNGEIFNHELLRTDYASTYPFVSHSDCEVLLPVYKDYGVQFLCEQLDGEFAFVIYDKSKGGWVAGRDPIGIRPLFYGFDKAGKICFASEAKALVSICKEIKPFPPGHFYEKGKIKSYLPKDWNKPRKKQESEKEIVTNIKELLIAAVDKRLHSDRPMGFLLSGGLDSSLVCSIAARIKDRPITTFAIGFEEAPIDLKYAREVAEFIGSDHHEVIFTRKQVKDLLPKLIYQLETYDITTVRASVGMYLLCEYIKEKTDIKVVLTGEVSDELFGYKYTDFAPSAKAFQDEAALRVEELYMYDVLRADRCISSHSLEARVPFADKVFVKYVMGIDPELKLNKTGVGKYLLRKAFEGEKLLPDSILYRDKAAFSDAVGHGMVDYLKELAAEKFSEQEVAAAKVEFSHAPPISAEALMYRRIFEEYFKDLSQMIKGFWMPNSNWVNCDVADPSARVLPNYGKSGV